jgi:hypothetical protein
MMIFLEGFAAILFAILAIVTAVNAVRWQLRAAKHRKPSIGFSRAWRSVYSGWPDVYTEEGIQACERYVRWQVGFMVVWALGVAFGLLREFIRTL